MIAGDVDSITDEFDAVVDLNSLDCMTVVLEMDIEVGTDIVIVDGYFGVDTDDTEIVVVFADEFDFIRDLSD